MKLNDIENAVEIQQKAYGLLPWLKDRAATNPGLFGADGVKHFSSGDACVKWVRQNLSAFPLQFRPRPDQASAFGYLLSSFFSTSFRVAEVKQRGAAMTTLVRGAAARSGAREKRRAAHRQEQVAAELGCLALTRLAEEQNFELRADKIEEAFANPEIFQDLALWTYGCELVRRCQFASQGEAVHRLWLELDEKVRKSLSAGAIWTARELLLRWLESKQ